MLVLTRKLQEQIRIGDDIVITVLQVRGQAVRIGIEAPKNIRVLRAELSIGEEVISLPTSSLPTSTLKVELSPKACGAKVTRRNVESSSSSSPLGARLQARRLPNNRFSNMSRPTERTEAALLAAVSAGQ